MVIWEINIRGSWVNDIQLSVLSLQLFFKSSIISIALLFGAASQGNMGSITIYYDDRVVSGDHS